MTTGTPPARRGPGYLLLAGLAALVIAVSGVIYVGFGGGPAGAGSRTGGPGTGAAASSGSWVGTWATAPAAAEPRNPYGHPDRSVRNVVHTTVGGTAARVHLSNLFGTAPLTVTHATVAVAAAPSTPTAKAGTMRRLTFGTETSVTLPPGGRVVSDPVRLRVPQATDLLVTVHTPGVSGPATYHPFARQTSYLAHGDRAGAVEGTAYTEPTPYWRYVTGVDVWTTETTGAIVALGDSITDGIASSTGANRRWTDFLAERLRTEPGAPAHSVLNAGISGNRALADAPAGSPANGESGFHRLERDVLSRTGVRTVVLQLGLNDLMRSPRRMDAETLVSGLEQLAARAQQRGLRVIGTTLTPFGGHDEHSPRLEAVRLAVNERIRTSTVFDAVADFDAAVRDPQAPQRLRAAYDSGDHLHPSDNGNRALAAAIDLADLHHVPGTDPTEL
ncbi:SGNH/GDSL hydrolase family protein [Streptomyces sp. GSL17-111]|uniref:SGNH/GDSL hydrolase family protein n=1 Tax=Streptomyces sp. GSL17-111 TaxID=3121596 RepID=UPI0030F49C70